jgi:hypothetical protein
MQRTTVVFPAPLKDLATARARSAGISFGEFVRRAVEKAAMETTRRQRGRRDTLLADRAVFNGRAPQDLSRRHDACLYGEP